MSTDESISPPTRKADSLPAQVFVGRARELDELRAGWSEVRRGHGRLFLVHGTAGIGKSRLCEQLSSIAAIDGARTAWGRCWEDGGAPALWPWIQIARRLIRQVDPRQVAQWLEGPASYLRHLLPELGDRSRDAAAGIAANLLNPRDSHFPMLEGIAEFLRLASLQGPLMLILDDLHAADEPSLLVLEFLSRELPVNPILILGTYREIEARRAKDRIELLNRIARHGHRLPLHGLTEHDIKELIERSFVRTPSPAVVHALHQATDGNPFFLDEVIRLLLATPAYAKLNHLPADGLPVPQAVRDAVRQRLHLLSPSCRRALEVASVLGRSFGAAALATVHDVKIDPLLEDLEEAVRHVLLVAPTNALGEYRFTHALIRDTLYDDLSVGDRRLLHRRVGQAFLEYHAHDLDGHAAEIAHHFLQGATVGDEGPAIDLAVRAARQAELLAAFDEAAQWYERALDLASLAPGEPNHRVELLLSLAEAQSRAWNTASAQDSFRRAARMAQSCIEANRPEAVTLFARAALGLGGTGIGIPLGTANVELIGLLETAASLLARDDDRALKARVLSRLALELYFADSADRRRRLLHESIELAQQSGEASALAFVLSVRLVAAWDTPDLEQRLRHADEAIVAASTAGVVELELRARAFRVMELVGLGRLREWQSEIERYAQCVARCRQPAYESTLSTLRTMTALWLGSFHEAEAMCLEQLAKAEKWEDQHARTSTILQLLGLRLLQGRAAEIEPLIRLAAAQGNIPPEGRTAFAILLATLGCDDEARPLFESLAAEDFADLDRGRHLASILAWLVELACRYGNEPQRRRLHQYVADLGEAHLHFASRLCFGPSEFFLGRLELALGENSAALEHLEVAVERCRQSGGRPALAAAQVALARCLLEFGDRDQAPSRIQSLLESAHEIATGLGMNSLLPELEKLRHESERPRQQAALEDLSFERASVGNGGRSARVVSLPVRALGNRKRDVVRTTDTKKSSLPEVAPSIFRFENGMWTVANNGIVLRLQRSKGLRYLAELLQAPEREIHALDLAALEQDSAEPIGQGTLPPQISQLRPSGIHIRHGDMKLERLDRQARDSYRKRIEELRDELQEATQFNDQGRMTHLQAELDVVTHELASALGFSGGSRATHSNVERARLNVTRALHTAIKRIREGNPDLGRHFANSVHTGNFCRYAPDPKQSIAWRL